MRRKLTEEQWNIREVQTAIDGICVVHGQIFSKRCWDCESSRANQKAIDAGTMCPTHKYFYDADGSCRGCISSNVRNSPEGVPHRSDDKYFRHDIGKKSIDEFDKQEAVAFIRARSRYKLEILEESQAKLAIQLTISTLGRKPDLQYASTRQGPMRYRSFIWGVNLESGVKISNILDSHGVKEFKITSDRWLTFWVRRDLTLSKLLKG